MCSPDAGPPTLFRSKPMTTAGPCQTKAHIGLCLVVTSPVKHLVSELEPGLGRQGPVAASSSRDGVGKRFGVAQRKVSTLG